MEEPNHVIRITNIKNREILEYPLIIFKGEIKTKLHIKCPQSSSLLVTHNADFYKTSLNDLNQFKILIDLEVGKNNVIFAYCCASINLTVEYVIRETDFSVIPLYIICANHDGNFQAPTIEPNTPESAAKRIKIGCKLIQSLVAEKLYEGNFGRKTFQLDLANSLIFYSKLPFQKVYKLSEMELWYYFAREIMGSNIGSESKKYLAFLSCTRYDGSKFSENMEYCDMVKLTKGYVAYGGEGLALLGTACLYTWPETVKDVQERFLDEQKVDRSSFMDDSCYRSTLGGCFSTTLGAALHELSHTFDLGHSYDGIMGRGFDNIEDVFLGNESQTSYKSKINIFNRPKISDKIFWTESCLAILNYHRWFNNYKTRTKANICYDQTTKIIRSTAGVRVVELRENENSMVIKYWVFVKKVLKFSYQIAQEFWETPDLLLFVEDSNGNILKTYL